MNTKSKKFVRKAFPVVCAIVIVAALTAMIGTGIVRALQPEKPAETQTAVITLDTNAQGIQALSAAPLNSPVSVTLTAGNHMVYDRPASGENWETTVSGSVTITGYSIPDDGKYWFKLDSGKWIPSGDVELASFQLISFAELTSIERKQIVAKDGTWYMEVRAVDKSTQELTSSAALTFDGNITALEDANQKWIFIPADRYDIAIQPNGLSACEYTNQFDLDGDGSYKNSISASTPLPAGQYVRIYGGSCQLTTTGGNVSLLVHDITFTSEAQYGPDVELKNRNE